ncbi:MAG: YIP1 family protein, partial [Candidatus Kapabacteria bacterium]|nr:YIP1 family protein [Candidatus Kapabacteria bacterium]
SSTGVSNNNNHNHHHSSSSSSSNSSASSASASPSPLVNTDEVVGRMKNITERMIMAYERQPCIAAWNICEGLEQSSSVTYSYIGTIAGILHKQSERPVLATVRFRSKNVIKDNVDGIIYMIDRFDMPPVQITAELQRVSQAGGKPFAFSFGKPINPDNRSGYADPISLEAQARYVKSCYEAMLAAQAGGAFVWSLTDYTLNRSTILTNTSGQYYCYSGLTDANRQKRVSFDMYKSLLNDEKDPLLQAGNYNETMPVIFIIMAVLLIILIVLMMNRSRRFREYVIRAMIYPYNFYSDIRDQRILSRQQTAVLCFIIAATGGILLSTILFYTRMSAIAEYAVMLLFPQEGMKGFISSLAWSPELGVAVITLAVVIGIILVAVLLRIGALFVRGRIFFSDTFIIAVWSALPMVLFLPFCTILFRALDVTPVTLWVVLLLLVMLWIFYRTMRATSVVFDVNPLPVYGIGILLIATLFGSIGFIYNNSYSFFAYAKYFLSAVL